MNRSRIWRARFRGAEPQVPTIAGCAAVLGCVAFMPCANAQDYSPTWSGYMVENGGSQAISYTSTDVSFAVPDVSCPNTGLGPAAGASFWAGLDHGGTSPIEKAGVMVTCDNTQIPPQPVYRTFWLMYVPGKPANIHFGFTPKPGDTIVARVTYANAAFQLSVAKAGPGAQSLSSGPQTCTAPGGCPRASVEWIAERSSDDVPLARYGCVLTVCSNQAPAPPGSARHHPRQSSDVHPRCDLRGPRPGDPPCARHA